MPASSISLRSSSAAHRAGTATPCDPANTSHGSRPPRAAQVLTVWAAASLLTFLLARLGAQDTPATPWAAAAPTWGEHLAFWDGGWYERIAREGYPSVLPLGPDGTVQQNAWAFMPALPFLAGLLSWTGLGFYVRATLVSLIASAGAALVMDRWLSPRVGERASLWAVGLVWSLPTALVLQVPYAESLGLLLVGATLMLTQERRFLAAAPVIVLAAVSRPVGVPLAAALGLWWLWESATAHDLLPGWDTDGGRTRTLLPGHTPLEARQRASLLALTALAAASALAWPLATWLVTGRRDAYTATETAWRGGSLTPFVPWLERGGWWVGGHLGLLLVVLLLALTALVLVARPVRALGPAAWFWCVGYVLYLLAFFDPTTSLLRILLPLAPLAWALTSAVRSRRTRAALLLLAVIGQLFWISWVWDLGSVVIQWVP